MPLPPLSLLMSSLPFLSLSRIVAESGCFVVLSLGLKLENRLFATGAEAGIMVGFVLGFGQGYWFEKEIGIVLLVGRVLSMKIRCLFVCHSLF